MFTIRGPGNGMLPMQMLLNQNNYLNDELDKTEGACPIRTMNLAVPQSLKVMYSIYDFKVNYSSPFNRAVPWYAQIKMYFPGNGPKDIRHGTQIPSQAPTTGGL